MRKLLLLLIACFTLLSYSAAAQDEVLTADGNSGRDSTIATRYAAGVNSWGIAAGLAAGTAGFIWWDSFPGPTGVYRVEMGAVLEADGNAKYRFLIAQNERARGQFPYAGGVLDCSAGAQSLFEVTTLNLGFHVINNGDEIRLRLESDHDCGANGAVGRFYEIRFFLIAAEEAELRLYKPDGTVSQTWTEQMTDLPKTLEKNFGIVDAATPPAATLSAWCGQQGTYYFKSYTRISGGAWQETPGLLGPTGFILEQRDVNDPTGNTVPMDFTNCPADKPFCYIVDYDSPEVSCTSSEGEGCYCKDFGCADSLWVGIPGNGCYGDDPIARDNPDMAKIACTTSNVRADLELYGEAPPSKRDWFDDAVDIKPIASNYCCGDDANDCKDIVGGSWCFEDRSTKWLWHDPSQLTGKVFESLCSNQDLVSDGNGFVACDAIKEAGPDNPFSIGTTDYLCKDGTIYVCEGTTSMVQNGGVAKSEGDSIVVNGIAYFCAKTLTGDPPVLERKWITNLDCTNCETACMQARDESGAPIRSYWTGSRCCGETGPEDYDDDTPGDRGACYDGRFVANRFPGTCSEWDPSVREVSGSGTTCAGINGEIIDKNIIAVDGILYGCKQDTGTGANNVDYCSVQAGRFCTYNDSTWSNEAALTRDAGGSLYTPGTRDTQKVIPPSTGEMVYTLPLFDFIQTYSEYFPNSFISNPDSRPRACCPEDACWNGVECEPPANDEPTRLPFILNRLDDGTGFRCIETNGVADWKLSRRKFSPDGREAGYCPEPTQCLYSTTGTVKCVDEYTYDKDDICVSGNWTTRTKLIALQLMEFAGGRPYTLYCDTYEEVVNFCGQEIYNGQDECERAFNLETFESLDIKGLKAVAANKLCVLLYDDDNEITTQDQVLIGASLNRDLYHPYDLIGNLYANLQDKDDAGVSFITALGLEPAASFRDICLGTASSTEFEKCANTPLGTSVFFNNRIKSVIYAPQALNANEFPDLSLNLIPDFSWKDSLFIAAKKMGLLLFFDDYEVANERFTYKVVESTSRFGRLYADRNQGKALFAVLEEQKYDTVDGLYPIGPGLTGVQSGIGTTRFTYLYIEQLGYNMPMCETLEALLTSQIVGNWEQNFRCRKSGSVTEIAAINKLQILSIWTDLTAGLRPRRMELTECNNGEDDDNDGCVDSEEEACRLADGKYDPFSTNLESSTSGTTYCPNTPPEIVEFSFPKRVVRNQPFDIVFSVIDKKRGTTTTPRIEYTLKVIKPGSVIQTVFPTRGMDSGERITINVPEGDPFFALDKTVGAYMANLTAKDLQTPQLSSYEELPFIFIDPSFSCSVETPLDCATSDPAGTPVMYLNRLTNAHAATPDSLVDYAFTVCCTSPLRMGTVSGTGPDGLVVSLNKPFNAHATRTDLTDPRVIPETIYLDNIYLYSEVGPVQCTWESDDDLIGWWPFEGNADDFSGNKEHGTIIGAGYNPTGGYDGKGAYQFDGVDDWISFGTVTAQTYSVRFNYQDTMASAKRNCILDSGALSLCVNEEGELESTANSEGGWTKIAIGGHVALSLAEFQDNLYIGTDTGSVLKYDGSTLADSPLNSGGVLALAVWDGKLYAGTGGGKVFVYDGTSWGLHANIGQGTPVISLFVFEDILHAGLASGLIYILDGQWQNTGELGINLFMSSFATWNEQLYAGASAGEVYRFTGTVWQSTGLNTQLASTEGILSLASWGGSLYAGSTDEKIYKYDGSSWSEAKDLKVGLQARTPIYSLGTWQGSLYAGSEGGKLHHAAAGATIKTSITSGWHHVVVSTSGTQLKLYLDDVEAGTGVSYSNPRNPINLRVGTGYGGEGIEGENFKGLIDEIKAWSAVLMPQEIQTIGECAPDEQCLFKLSSNRNAHVAACVDAQGDSVPYPVSRCCKIV